MKEQAYSVRLENRRKELGLTIAQVFEGVKKRVPPGRGRSYRTLCLYLSSMEAPANPRPAIIQAVAEVLGVTVEWAMGEVDDPSEAGLLELRGLLEAGGARRKEVVRKAFPRYDRLSPVAKAAIMDLADVLKTQDALDADVRGSDRTWDYHTAAGAVGKALAASLKALKVDPGEVYPARLNDCVVLVCTGLKRAVRRT